MNRIVIFSDIHGNVNGLKAVMNCISKLENVTKIINCGDNFDWGAGTDEIIDICNENDVVMLLGGHEQYLYNFESDAVNTSQYWPIHYDHING